MSLPLREKLYQASKEVRLRCAIFEKCKHAVGMCFTLGRDPAYAQWALDAAWMAMQEAGDLQCDLADELMMLEISMN